MACAVRHYTGFKGDLSSGSRVSPLTLILASHPQFSPDDSPQDWEGAPRLPEDTRGHRSTATGPAA